MALHLRCPQGGRAMTDEPVFCLDDCHYYPNHQVQSREVPPPIHAAGCPNSDSRYVKKLSHYDN